MVTILPGDTPEALYGHSAIRVYDPEQGIDLLYNYGTFQFDQYFLPKFIYGDLNYFLSVVQFQRALPHYRAQGRPVIEQVLNLSPDQMNAIHQFLIINAREENRYYQYDFLFDNCSTRIRDLKKEVLEEDIRFASRPDPGKTFRELIGIYQAHRPFLDFGIDLALGSHLDRVAEPYETMFLPDYLLEAFDYAEIRIDGEFMPLVANTDTLMWIDGYSTEMQPGLPWAAICMWLLLGLGVFITYRAKNRYESIKKWFDVILFTITGILGLLIVFLWFISLHEVTVSNLNLFWAWPTHLFAGIYLLSQNSSSRVIGIYFAAAAIVTAVILAGWFFWPQVLHPAVVPVLLLMIVRCGSISVSILK